MQLCVYEKKIYLKIAQIVCAPFYNIKMAIDQYYNSQHPGPLKIYIEKKSCDWL